MPVVIAVALQRLSRIFYPRRRVAFDLSRIPHVALVAVEQSLVRSDEDPVSRLKHAPPVGFEFPAQPRLQYVDPDRVGHLFAAEAGYALVRK